MAFELELLYEEDEDKYISQIFGFDGVELRSLGNSKSLERSRRQNSALPGEVRTKPADKITCKTSGPFPPKWRY